MTPRCFLCTLFEYDGLQQEVPPAIEFTAKQIRPRRNDSTVLPVHTIRIRWTPARSASGYRVHCEANTTEEVRTSLEFF
ncbi:unnamed protein product [Nippostrongylus brasiliensis]|uniref:Fibronectin type-III domain-containing protein n=1 Tax=Nippostrongylus brasiliensis TaxID=27835 RepID=A0A0N4YZV2_NIPBR|nr:unnamed protein product [Nippostrongylus brasiliensis]